ncbi:MAG: esterase/lipase [Phenylobacterium sp.]
MLRTMFKTALTTTPRKIILILSALLLSACSNIPDEPAYKTSNSTLPSGQNSFADYAQSTRQWLAQNRWFLSADKQAELDANSPFELLPQVPLAQRHGILLVHGLNDSPYSFVDIAPMLAKMGFHVRTLLLEGHGSRPADLINADHQHWQSLVRQQTELFKADVDKLWLGGFSTGANLVTDYALNDDDIQGLLLFSPGFKALRDIAQYAPLYSVFKDWIFTPSLTRQTNYVRYHTSPTNGYAQYYHTSQSVLDGLEARQYTRPVFIAISEDDSVLDVDNIRNLFETRMTHPANRLIWFGNPPGSEDSRVLHFNGKVPEFRVSNFSHMGLLFDPDNAYYGTNGTERICSNGQSDKHFRQCYQRKPVWYSAWGHTEGDKPHARLTFNPWFKQMSEIIRGVVFAD